jgi:hypothetical protein
MTDPAAPPSTPAAKRLTVSLDLAQLPSVATAFGVALVSATVVLSTFYARIDGSLDKSTYTMGVLATLGLLGVAIGGHWLVPDAERRATLVSWPGTAGTIGAGLMIAVLVDDGTWSAYLGALVVLVLSVAGYVVAQAAPFVLSAIAGLGVLYIQVFSDAIDLDGDGKNIFIIIGAAILVFVAAVTAFGWLLPKTRVLSSVVVGIGAIFAFSGVFQGMVVFGAFSSMSSTFESSSISEGSGSSLSSDELPEPTSLDEADMGSMDDEFDDDEFEDSPTISFNRFNQQNPFTNDIWVTLGYSVALALFWALCAMATGHIAFRILSTTILLFSIPAATISLAVSHPTWWQVALCAVGGLLLAGIGYRLGDKRAPTRAQ